jgi:hypothetical protein
MKRMGDESGKSSEECADMDDGKGPDGPPQGPRKFMGDRTPDGRTGKGKSEIRGGFDHRLKDMKDRGKFDDQKGQCDASEFKSKMDEVRNKAKSAAKDLDFKGIIDKSATCDDTKMENAQTVLAPTGSCGADAIKGLQKRGFAGAKGSMQKGVQEGTADCKQLEGDKLDIALALSDDDLDDAQSFVSKSRSASDAISTFADRFVKQTSTSEQAPGNAEMLKCLNAVAPEEVKKVKCEIGLQAMKSKFGCDLSGEKGMEAAFGGRGEDLEAGKIKKGSPGRGFGQGMKYKAMCDRPDRVKDIVQSKGQKCPCSFEAFKELAECADVDSKGVFDGACSAGEKMSLNVLKQQFPNCVLELAKALGKDHIKSKLTGRIQMTVSDISELLDSGNTEKAKVAVARVIAKRVKVDEDNVVVKSIEAASRRLEGQRRLSSGDVNIVYEIHSEAEPSSSTVSAIELDMADLSNNNEALQNEINAAFVEEDLSVTADSVVPSAIVATGDVDTPTYGPTSEPTSASSALASTLGLSAAFAFAGANLLFLANL